MTLVQDLGSMFPKNENPGKLHDISPVWMEVSLWYTEGKKEACKIGVVKHCHDDFSLPC